MINKETLEAKAWWRMSKVLYIGLFLFGICGIVFFGWFINAGNNDTTLNTLVCADGHTYQFGKFTTWIQDFGITSLQDYTFRYECHTNRGISQENEDKLKNIVDYAYTQKWSNERTAAFLQKNGWFSNETYKLKNTPNTIEQNQVWGSVILFLSAFVVAMIIIRKTAIYILGINTYRYLTN